MSVVAFVYADGSHTMVPYLDSHELMGGPAHFVIETDAISTDVLSTRSVSVDIEAGTYTAKAWTREEMMENLESLKDPTDEGTGLSQGVLNPEKRQQKSESAFPRFRQLWQSIVDFLLPKAQTATQPFHEDEKQLLAFVQDCTDFLG